MSSYETLKKKMDLYIKRCQRYERILREIATSSGPALVENPRKAMEALFHESEAE